MHAQENDRTVRAESATRTSSRTPAVAGGAPAPHGLMELQATVGNAAVVQMLRRTGYAGEGEGHRHGAGCGHGGGEGVVQRSAVHDVQRSAVHDVLRTPGRPLDDATRGDMEARLGADFSDVRIHNDAAAKASAAEVGARAYTSGSHVVIGDGGADKHTLAHELTHVIQQRSGPVAGTVNGAGLKVSDPSDRFEREAEANATRVMRSAAPEAAGTVQRASERGAARTAPAAGVAAVQRAAELNGLAGGGTAGTFGQAVAGAEPEGTGTVAIVPVVLSQGLNLMEVAQKYEEGFAGGTAPADRFALVIGVNIRIRNPQEANAAQTLLNQKVTAFLGAWGANRFKVAVIGFTWANYATDSQETNQRTIPYGEIRNRIMRDPETTSMIAGLRESGSQHVYLHTSDADTASFQTEAGPLFSAAAEHLESGELDVFSGGYTSPAASRTTDNGILIWHASQIDLAVRKAMAEVDPYLVYYPEPSTFVKVQDYYDNLEPSVTFGSGAEEGQHLVDSLAKARNEATGEGMKGAFDPRFAISTDMGRVGQNVGPHASGAAVTDATIQKLFALAQTHARPQEWSKRVEQAYGVGPSVSRALEDLVFAGLTMDDLAILLPSLPPNPIGATAIDRAARKGTLKGVDGGVVETAKASRDALVRALVIAVRALQAR
ncbi:eCIS core domain-containing protein [Streptomyces cyaneofuscatus]|uniref:eCIS core domain-containing protein n=1 Tax=Streptomyces cyaneofuscatus TaxID=66883 RepID=UPI00342C913A